MLEYYLVVFRQIDFFKIFKNIMFLGFGIILLILGIFGLILPVMPGLLLIFLGLSLMVKGSRYLKEHKMLNKYLDSTKKIVYKYRKV